MERVAARRVDACDGDDLRGMFAAATLMLEKNAAQINSLNVFPVPDGDTGTNMLLTMRATMEEAYRSPERSASVVARAMARGALMGARGNSGVILSQILGGLARGFDNKESFCGSDLASALAEASDMAYKGVSRPVEGTILTVIREAASAAQTMTSADKNDVLAIVEATVKAAKAAVARTPALLPVLREAGVVDAGGQGLYVVLDGARRFLHGEMKAEESPQIPQVVETGQLLAAGERLSSDERVYGYCTEFLIESQDLNIEEIRERLASLGDSTLVVGDAATVRVHLHTFDPGAAISYATSLGTLHQVKVQNIDEQHEDFIAMRKDAPPLGEVATVAVATGDGLTQVLKSLGATAIVPGGQTMNPSTEELLRAIQSVPQDKVIMLPNNSNIVATAKQAQALSTKEVIVVPTETIPQGVAALLAFSYEADLDANAAAMEEAISTVSTVEIATAVRSTQASGLKVSKGQAIGLLNGELVVAGDDRHAVATKILAKLGLGEGRLITIYYGADTDYNEAEEVAQSIRHTGAEVELVQGGQPFYNYIISIE